MAWFRRGRSEREEGTPTEPTVDEPVAEARTIAAALCEELGWPPAWVLEQNARYVSAVRGLRSAQVPTEALLGLLGGDHVLYCMALAVLSERNDLPAGWREILLERLPRTSIGEEHLVRRYRERDAPLVRDAGRRYRTGRLDRVLAGDFDLF